LKEFIFPTKTYLELKTQIIIIAIKSAKMVMWNQTIKLDIILYSKGKIQFPKIIISILLIIIIINSLNNKSKFENRVFEKVDSIIVNEFKDFKAENETNFYRSTALHFIFNDDDKNKIETLYNDLFTDNLQNALAVQFYQFDDDLFRVYFYF